MNIVLKKVNLNEKNILRNLYAFYLHDLSAFSSSLEPNQEGFYDFDAFNLIWEKEGLSPYFIIANGKLAGFFLLIEPPFVKKADYCINDFFLYHPFRGKGVGKGALEVLFKEKPGSYYVLQLKENKKAINFWKKIITRLGTSFREEAGTEDGEEIVSQVFEVNGQ